MSAHFESLNLRGFAHWMRVQAQEEWGHGMKFYAYVHERGGRVTLRAIDEPPSEWDSPLAVFQSVARHEAKVTELIYKLVDQAEQERDHATASFLKWFVDEQVEEEASAGEIVQKLGMVEKAPGGLFMLDRELGSRPGAGEGEG